MKKILSMVVLCALLLTALAVSTKGADAVLTWKGTADAYDVRCINNKTGEKVEFFDVTTTSQVITGLPEGMCTYYVRSKCGGVIGAGNIAVIGVVIMLSAVVVFAKKKKVLPSSALPNLFYFHAYV